MSDVERLYATAATADKIDAALGVIWWAAHAPGGYALSVVDFDLFEVEEVNAEWLTKFFERSADLVDKHAPAEYGCRLRVEHAGLLNVLNRADEAWRDDEEGPRTVNRAAFDIRPIAEYEASKWPATLDERAFAIRPLVDSGKVVKLEKGLRRFNFRSVRTNHLVAQIRKHRPGDPGTSGELLQAFVLGVLLGTTPRRLSLIDFFSSPQHHEESSASPAEGPFGFYVPGPRPR